ncbi:centrosomal protein of 170 kDa protein B isoform X3 [Patella vulgata]|uniref:centrosomal protein of 170 kDa protein B isoform X3 n=1 Tax=Patella vulgata TaxID=6465 RepID=UPI0024A89D57|nr:centrosomal protein of 170 kDa protein B isoform X3 [Patella vulgata]
MDEELDQEPLPDDWYLVESNGHRSRIPRTMLFMGREHCDVQVKSDTVDKRHAVLTYDVFLSKFKIKDLSSINKTYVNSTRIQEQEYVTLNHMDTVQLGHDSPIYRVEQGGHPDSACDTTQGRVPNSNNKAAIITNPSVRNSTQGIIDGPNCMTVQGHPDIALTWPQVKLRRLNAGGIMPENNGYNIVSSDPTFPVPLSNDNYNHEFMPLCNQVPDPVPPTYTTVADKPESKTYEYDVYLNQDSTSENGISHVHGKIILEELETAKKTSALYGQPDWWGENEINSNGNTLNPKREDDHENKDSSDRPSSLEIQKKQREIEVAKMEKYKTDPRYQQTYMEIPMNDLVDEKNETPQQSVASSLSKDSLLSPPDTNELDNKDKTLQKTKGKSVDSSMVFTIDFGEDTKQKKNKNSGNLSDLMPSRLKERFQERQSEVNARKEKNKSPDSEIGSSQHKKVEDVCGFTESKKSRKSSEQISASRKSDIQKKPYSRRKSVGEESRGKSSTPKSEEDSNKSMTRKELRSSTRKSPLEEARTKARKSSVDETRTKNTRMSPLAERSKRTQHKSPVEEVKGELSVRKSPKQDRRRSPQQDRRRSPQQDRRKSPQQERIICDENRNVGSRPVKSTSKQSPVLRSVDGGNISPSNYSDTTSYLIDKMFEGTKETAVGVKSGDDISINNDEEPKRISCTSPEDKLSDAGTYTIETEEAKDEEEAARRRIDEVFGVIDQEEWMKMSGVIGDNELQITEVNVSDGTGTQNSTPTDEFTRQMSLDVQDGSYPEDLCNGIYEDQRLIIEEYKMASVQDGEVPIWMSQLANLTNQKSANKISSERLEHEASQDGSAVKGISRKRPGTGRRLPSVPTSYGDTSSVRSESSHLSGEDTPRLNVNERCKTVTISSPAVVRNSHPNISSMSRTHSDSGSESGKDKKSYSVCDSSRSMGSLDTQTLLKDTETVMAAMEARMATKRINGHSFEYDSDTDVSSTVALVNGNESYKRNSFDYKSPRNCLSEKKTSSPRDSYQSSCTTSSPRDTPSPTERSSYSKPPSGPSAKKPPLRTKSLTSTPRSKSLMQRHSLGDFGDSESVRTDSDTESLKSQNKAPMSHTRPNRSFLLRRSRAMGSETTTTPSDTTRSSSSSITTSSARSATTSKSTSRPNTSRTDASLGAHIVKKSQANAKASQSIQRDTNSRKSLNVKSSTNSSKTDLTRSDGGRHSLRLTRTASGPAPVENSKRRADLKTLKSQLKKTDLSVKGSKAGSQSQPASRTNSPKTAAWKRRKDYDPRKAVADAKAKSKAAKTKTNDEHNTTSLSRMTRSSSFTTAAELSGRVRKGTYRSESTSSVEDVSAIANEAIDNFNEDAVRCAFIPIGNTLRSDRMSHSADEEEFSSHSAQELSRSMTLADNVRKSAFTTPSPKQMSASPLQRSPSLPRSRRSTFGAIEYNDQSSQQNGLHRAESYNPLLVTSIYQLSLKMKTDMDRILHKLQDDNRLTSTPSPIDDFLDQPGKSEFPAWKSANQELAGILKNLRRIEHQNHAVKAVLFPDENNVADISGVSHREKQKYFQQINRLSREITEFQPIDNPNDNCFDEDTESPDMAECGEVEEEEFY